MVGVAFCCLGHAETVCAWQRELERWIQRTVRFLHRHFRVVVVVVAVGFSTRAFGALVLRNIRTVDAGDYIPAPAIVVRDAWVVRAPLRGCRVSLSDEAASAAPDVLVRQARCGWSRVGLFCVLFLCFAICDNNSPSGVQSGPREGLLVVHLYTSGMKYIGCVIPPDSRATALSACHHAKG